MRRRSFPQGEPGSRGGLKSGKVRRLSFTHPLILARFESVKREALAALDELMAVEREPRNRSRLERYSTDHWLRERLFVQQYVQNGLSASFRRSDALGRQITCVAPKSPYVDQYCRYIFSREDFLTERLREGSVESRIGRPYLEYTSGHIVYSTNTIEHLYYLARLIRNTESRLPEVGSIGV